MADLTRIPLINTPWLVPDGQGGMTLNSIWFQWLQKIDAKVSPLPPPAPSPPPPPPILANMQFQDDSVNVGPANPLKVSFDANLAATYDIPNTTVRVAATVSAGSNIVFLNANSMTLINSDDGKTYFITNGGGVDFNVNFTSITDPPSPFRVHLVFVNALNDFVVNFLTGMSAWQFFDTSSTGASASRRTFGSPGASFVITHLHPSGGVDAWNVQENPTNTLGVRSELMLGGQADLRISTVTDVGAFTGANGAPPAQVAGYLRATINGTVIRFPFYL